MTQKFLPLQISSIPGSVGDSLIQLNRADCHVKLAFDLLYLFVYKPTPQLMLPVVHMDSLYQQCHGHKLIPAVYGMKSLQGLIGGAKRVSEVIKVHIHVQVTLCTCTAYATSCSPLNCHTSAYQGFSQQYFQAGQHWGAPTAIAHAQTFEAELVM